MLSECGGSPAVLALQEWRQGIREASWRARLARWLSSEFKWKTLRQWIREDSWYQPQISIHTHVHMNTCIHMRIHIPKTGKQQINKSHNNISKRPTLIASKLWLHWLENSHQPQPLKGLPSRHCYTKNKASNTWVLVGADYFRTTLYNLNMDIWLHSLSFSVSSFPTPRL